MANKELFGTTRGRFVPPADTVNEAGGVAYKMEDEHALAQYACTGCLNSTYYASADTQLSEVLRLAKGCSDGFLARTAVYARKKGFMKDLPALLCAILAGRKTPALESCFHLTIDNPKMLRNFVQIVRSGVAGRKSLGTMPRRLVRQWFERKPSRMIFNGSVGKDPSMADIIKMVHPKPRDAERKALYAYLIGKLYNGLDLPEIVRHYENYKEWQRAEDKPDKMAVPDVPFQMLTALNLGKEEWTEIAWNAPWQMTRMNLNTFQRHGVFDDPAMVDLVARRLKDAGEIARSRCFPYQLLMAYKSTADVPFAIQEALQDAMEIAISNVPTMNQKIYVFPDVSGSMHSPVTGRRKGSTTKVRIVDVAALVAAALMRVNRQTSVVPFEYDFVPIRLNPRDSVMSNAQRLASVGGGATNCSAPLSLLNFNKAMGDLLIYVSDYESWIDVGGRYRWGRSGTETMREWGIFKGRNPNAKMICIDVAQNASTQAKEMEDVYNVGGFSDQVFHFIRSVAAGEAKPGFWVDQIKGILLNDEKEVTHGKTKLSESGPGGGGDSPRSGAEGPRG